MTCPPAQGDTGYSGGGWISLCSKKSPGQELGGFSSFLGTCHLLVEPPVSQNHLHEGLLSPQRQIMMLSIIMPGSVQAIMVVTRLVQLLRWQVAQAFPKDSQVVAALFPCLSGFRFPSLLRLSQTASGDTEYSLWSWASNSRSFC